MQLSQNTYRMTVQEINDLNLEPILKQNLTFTFEQEEYQILSGSDNLIGSGGEAQVYKAVRTSDQKSVAAKIYIELSVNSITKQRRDKLCQFIMEHSNPALYHLMPIFAHGVIDVMDEMNKNYPRFIEIMPNIAIDGQIIENSGAVSYDLIKTKLIPQLLVALNTLHAENWVHRDVKPANLYYLGYNLVLGDFGACSQVAEKNSKQITMLKTGTPGYAAPEVANSIASKASDCFSLGVTLMTLYLGHHYSKEMGIEAEGIDYARCFSMLLDFLTEGKLPFNIKESQSKFKHLLIGLLQYDPHNRYTLKEVEGFCKDPFPTWSPPSIKYKNTVSVLFDGLDYSDKESLANAMAKKWDKGKIFLYQGGEKNSSFVLSIQNLDGLGTEAMIIIQKTPREMEDEGLSLLLYKMSPNMGYCWKGSIYEDYAMLSRSLLSEDKVIRDLALSFLGTNVLLEIFMQKAEKQIVIEYFTEIKQKSSVLKTQETARYWAAFALSNQADELAKGLHKNADDFFASFLSKTDEDLCQKLQNLVLRFPAQSAWFKFNIGYDIWPLFDNEDSLIKTVIMIFRFFESYCINKTMVREQYILKGPYGHLSWIQKNLSIYKFTTNSAKTIEANIMGYRLSPEMSIDDLNENFGRLDTEIQEMKRFFQGSLSLAKLGYTCGKPIFSSDENAYFTHKRFEMMVPLGFQRMLTHRKYQQSRSDSNES